ncbi:hypothetical protein DYY67_1826 [Candidatus Nitrosotalea sp. TS]|uniref:amino acid kinase family protein n=1 Tax=Candidatus Nitrosotalea sp. TS TaxID=2341020 RepID=UPI001EBB7ED2|nr:hypothetical protein [Candidatus Nitrosotalea sp. TS]NHI02750.1 hypothetical protein [Candidatus Nitrosotalea sp. TS]
MKLVLKFGGTSIASAANVRNVANLIKSLSKDHKIIPVFSAMSGVTDDLIRITSHVKDRNTEAANSLAKKIIRDAHGYF